MPATARRVSSVDQDGHQLRSFASATTFSAASFIVFAGCTLGSVGLREEPAALDVVRAVEAHDERDVGVELGERLDQAARDLVAARDAAEDVEEDRLDLRVGEHHLDGGRDRLGVRAAARVEEVRRLAARLRDDVERAHHEPGAVAEDADVAVELDVLQPERLAPCSSIGSIGAASTLAPRSPGGGRARCRRA